MLYCKDSEQEPDQADTGMVGFQDGTKEKER